MKKLQLGWILFPKDGEDFWTGLEAYAKIGYTGMEMGQKVLEQPGDEAENIARFKALGLEAITVRGNDLTVYDERSIDQKIEQVKKLDADFVCCYVSGVISPMTGGTACTDDEFFCEIENLEKAAERFKAAGVKFAYHNHGMEFGRMIHGVSAYDQMVARTSTLLFEPDVGWATYAGVDPIALLDRLGDRVIAVHFKDYVPGKTRIAYSGPTLTYEIPDFTAVGTGVVNTFGVAQWAVEHGIRWGVVEQDALRNLSSVETLQSAYLNLKESGFAE